MGKKVFVVPPQQVSVNVSVNVGQQMPQQMPQQQMPQQQMPQQQMPQQQMPQQMPQVQTQVSAAVQAVTPAWPPLAQPVAVPVAPYRPPFAMPTSNVLRRKIPALARTSPSLLGDHVHTPRCAESGCPLLGAQLPTRVTARPAAMLGWLLVALCVWMVQYTLIVPLAWLGAVATSGAAKAIGWVAILLCGLGPFYALFYLCSPAVPRQALLPWGLNAGASG